jgi:parvulin-like peptidyl-prolyl isomerase
VTVIMMKNSSLLAVVIGGIALGGCASRGGASSQSAANEQSESPMRVADAGSAAPALSPAPQPPPTTMPRAAAQSFSTSADQVVARVNGNPITMRQLTQPLVEGYGLNILLNLVQLELAKQDAARKRITLSPHDIEVERDQTLSRLFQDADKADYDELFEQFLQQQRISKPEFDIVLTTNAYLRKIAEPQLKGMINEQNLQEAYRQMYGEKVQVRHIQCANMTEILEAKRMLAEGKPFEQVAQELSRNQHTAGLGGELPPFSRSAANFPQAFKDAAFALKVGEVSDPVQADGAFHLIKLEQRIQPNPNVVKYEDVKESVRQELEDKLLQAAVKQMRQELTLQALKALQIDEPTLKAQFEARKL